MRSAGTTVSTASDTNGSTSRQREVVACDRDGNPTGTAGLLEAHSGDGILHRAFSVFVFREGGRELLLQRRSSAKATFPLLWSNTCCSHPYPADAPLCELARRRLTEELGFDVGLVEAGSFVYRARDDRSRFTEYEHDSVLVGWAEEEVAIDPDPAEVEEYRWAGIAELRTDLDQERDKYSPWFPDALEIALRSSGSN